MGLKPRDFERGRPFHEQVSAERLNGVLRAIPRVRYSGSGVRVSHLGDQTFVTFASRPVAQSTSTGTLAWPFKVYPSGTQVFVNSTDGYVGTINSIIATVNGVTLGISTPATGIQFLPVMGSNYAIYINCTLDATQNITAVEVDGAPSMPTNPVTGTSGPSNAYQLIAIATASGSSTTVANTSNTGFTGLSVCGGPGLWQISFY